MATALQPRLTHQQRARLHALPTARRPLQRIDELDALGSRWRLALDAAQTALQAAPAALGPESLRGRSSLLKAERTETARLLENLARDFSVNGWLSDLEIPSWNMYRLLGLPETLRGCIFDLEDVLTGSPAVHIAAWSETWTSFASERSGHIAGHWAPFDPRLDYYAHVHARPRLEGVREFLASRGIALPEGSADDSPGCRTVHALANLKQRSLLRRLDSGALSALAGSRRYLQLARHAGLRCAAVSASANTQTILAHTGLEPLVATTVDGTTMLTQQLRRSPSPDALLTACRQLDLAPDLTAGFMATTDGVKAGRAAGLQLVVGIGEPARQRALRECGADIVVSGLRELLDRRLAVTR